MSEKPEKFVLQSKHKMSITLTTLNSSDSCLPHIGRSVSLLTIQGTEAYKTILDLF